MSHLKDGEDFKVSFISRVVLIEMSYHVIQILAFIGEKVPARILGNGANVPTQCFRETGNDSETACDLKQLQKYCTRSRQAVLKNVIYRPEYSGFFGGVQFEQIR